VKRELQNELAHLVDLASLVLFKGVGGDALVAVHVESGVSSAHAGACYGVVVRCEAKSGNKECSWLVYLSSNSILWDEKLPRYAKNPQPHPHTDV
jgi:hypothetical protein